MHLEPIDQTDDCLENSFTFVYPAIVDYREVKERLQERLRTLDLMHAAEAARVQKLILYVEHRANAVGACV